MRVYLDHNAGSPLRPQVKQAVMEALDLAANASSVHEEGRKAKGLVERARQSVANMVGAVNGAVTFTSGGSEANATILQPCIIVKGKTISIDRLLVSATEHDSVLKGGRFAAGQIDIIPVDADGIIDLAFLSDRLSSSRSNSKTALVGVMLANNETGVLQPVEAVGQLVAEHEAYFLCDAVQGPGKLAVDIERVGAHFLTLSSHKLGGPQGAGAIVRRSEAYAFQPLIRGGGQESFGRAGTENIAAIHGFGVAAELIAEDASERDRIAALRDTMEQQLTGVVVLGSNVDRLPNTSCISVPGLTAETILISLDLLGFAVSSGSACSSGKVGVSHVLTAMNVAQSTARGALRVSLGWNTTGEQVKLFVEAFNNMAATLSSRQRVTAA
uniref:cysteine desulfurase family protein n=1 Tax=Pararhizobium sp. IMCC3301 TaxID=3067904 RepID=UPI00274134FC|nr:cysteine desulfurase family protein [Pararhizobium sp. IMCC3301]